MNKIPLKFLVFLVAITMTACSNPAIPTESQQVATVVEAPALAEPPQSSPPTPTEEVISGTISLWHSLETAQIAVLLRQIAAFQEDYPNVYFDVLYVPQIDLLASFEEAAREGSGPKILIGSGEWGPELYDQGMLAGLNALAGSDLLNTLNPAAAEAARYQDTLIGMPFWMDGVVLYRNRALIPRAAETFDELVLLSQEVDEAEVYGAYLERSIYFSGAHLYGLGGSIMDETGAPAFNSPEGLEWIELLLDFEQAGPADFFTDNDLNLFKEGKVGFLVDGTWNKNALLEAIGAANLAIDPWPIFGRGGLSGFIRTENIYLSPRALDESHNLSWKFIELLMTPTAQSGLVDTGLIPVLSGAPENPVAGQLVISDPLIAQAMRAMVNAEPYPINASINLYATSLDIALRSVFEGVASPAEALQGAENAILENLAAVGATATPSP